MPTGMLWLRRLLIFAIVLAIPEVAWAGQCEDIGMTLDESECFVVDGDDVRTIPMCSLDAASVTAPQIIHAPSDARIEAAKRCQTFEADDAASTPDREKRHERNNTMDVDAPPLPILSTVAALTVMQRARDGAAARSGEKVGVYRPPQA